MQIRMIHGLPIVSLSIEYNNRTIELTEVLFDTGCAATVFDTDVLATVGLYPDFINGTVKRMYGIGGPVRLVTSSWFAISGLTLLACLRFVYSSVRFMSLMDLMA